MDHLILTSLYGLLHANPANGRTEHGIFEENQEVNIGRNLPRISDNSQENSILLRKL